MVVVGRAGSEAACIDGVPDDRQGSSVVLASMVVRGLSEAGRAGVVSVPDDSDGVVWEHTFTMWDRGSPVLMLMR